MNTLLLLALAASPGGARSEPLAPVVDRDYVLDVNRRARGFGIGFAQGLWGEGFGQSLRFEIPFGRRVGQFFGMRVAPTMVHTPSSFDDYDPTVFGIVELTGRSPVIHGLVRLYGGGGVHFGGPAKDLGDEFSVAGGGHMGIEVFVNPRLGFSIEVGGQGPLHRLSFDAGPHVMGGITGYFGR